MHACAGEGEDPRGRRASARAAEGANLWWSVVTGAKADCQAAAWLAVYGQKIVFSSQRSLVQELSILTDKLQKINEGLAWKIQARSEYDKTIQDRPTRRHLPCILPSGYAC